MSVFVPRSADMRTGLAFRRHQVLVLFLCVALIAAMHLPGPWQQGRFFDEEATVFLAYAWHFPASDALLRPFAGYLNLAANAATLGLAQAIKTNLIQLEQAPYVTMLLGLASQMIPVLLVLTGKAPWLTSRRTRLGAALFIAIAPGTEEVLANVIHIQFHLALAVALILCIDVPQRRFVRQLYFLPLLLAPLCGPAAILLLPLFVLRALVDRDVGRRWQCLWLALGSMLQLAVFYGDSPIRSVRPDLFTAGAGTFLRLVLMPLFGSGAANEIGHHIATFQEKGLGLTAALAIAACGLFVFLLFAAWRNRSRSLWLLAACLIVAVPCFTLGMATAYPTFVLFPGAGPRYNYIPVVLLGLAVAAHFHEAQGLSRILVIGVSAMVLTTSVVSYFKPGELFADGPSWQAEVAQWRANPNYSMKVWGSSRVVDLSGNARRCQPVSIPGGDPQAPIYCEAGWMVDFFPDASRQIK